jgi:hypothetical protein
MSSPHYTVDPAGCLEPVIGQGVAGWKPKTVIEVFQETVRKHPEQPALCFKKPKM